MKYSEVQEKYSDFVIVMAFAVHDEKMLARVKELSQEHTLYFPDVPVVGDGIFSREYIEEHEEDFDKAYSLLSDEKSKQSYIDILNFKVSGKTEYLFKCERKKEEIYTDYLCPNDDEILMDLGAYDGDTIREFLNVTDYEKFLRENGLYHEGARKVVITGQMADATGLILALEKAGHNVYPISSFTRFMEFVLSLIHI